MTLPGVGPALKPYVRFWATGNVSEMELMPRAASYLTWV
jgi:hypothetical protein